MQSPATDTEDVRPRAPWTVDWAHPCDEDALLRLFKRAFGHEMPAAQWRWKYGGLDPTGTLVRRGERIVAFYGGMPRNIVAFGAPDTAVQIGDVMVDPAERGVLTRKGPFFLATSTFLNARIGVGKPYRYGYGFPHERAMKIAERLGLYAPVDELLEATWQPLPAARSLALRARPVQPAQMPTVDRLWSAMARDARDVVIGVRNAPHVQHRFLDHPATRYLSLLVTTRWLRRPVGLVVLRDRAADGLEFIDVVGPRSAVGELVTTARRAAAAAGRERLFAWMTPSTAAWFSASEPAVTPTGYIIPASALDAPDNALQVRGKWWLIGGDTDFR